MYSNILTFFLILGVACGGEERAKVPKQNSNPPIDEERRKKQIEDAKKGLVDSGTTTNTDTDTDTETNNSTTLTKVNIPSLGISLFAQLRTGLRSTQKLVVFFSEEASNIHIFDLLAPQITVLGFDTLCVDLRHGGSAFGFENETVKNLGGTPDSSFATMNSDIHSVVSWANQQAYQEITLTAGTIAAGAIIKEARTNPLVDKIAVFSPSEFVQGESIINYTAQITKPFYIAAPVSEKAAIDTLLGGTTLKKNLIRNTKEAGDHGIALLRTDAVFEDYLAFIIESL